MNINVYQNEVKHVFALKILTLMRPIEDHYNSNNLKLVPIEFAHIVVQVITWKSM